jgi:hypothetical protein
LESKEGSVIKTEKALEKKKNECLSLKAKLKEI